MRRILRICCIVALVATTAGDVMAQAKLLLGTTTSTEDAGLLNVLLPPFEKTDNVKVEVISKGTGYALSLGENGEVDVVLVHDRPAEDKFVVDGFGVDRKDVMHNDFIIIGPKEDPANVKEAKSAVDAFKRIAEAKAEFISRGDKSGTNQKEKEVWTAAGIKPEGKWYMVGQGMGHAIQTANDKKAYTLADRGTYLSYVGKIDMPILFEGDKTLFNPYGVIAVNPKKHPRVRYDLAKKFIGYITGPEGQKIIGDFKINGKQLFFPDAAKEQK
jgi:tungstate transport system substrate-binding protein